jgi:hypothetical protein
MVTIQACVWHIGTREKKWRIEVRERVMVVVKQQQPNAFFSFSFSCRLIVNIVRRRKKKERKTKTTMMMRRMVVVVQRSRVLRTTVRMSTMKHCRRSMILLTYSTFYLMTCWCCIQPFGRCCKKKKKRKEEKKRREGRRTTLFFFWFFVQHNVWIKPYADIQLLTRNKKISINFIFFFSSMIRTEQKKGEETVEIIVGGRWINYFLQKIDC